MGTNATLLTAAVAAIFAAGVEVYIWTVAYPAFAMIDARQFSAFHIMHSSRIALYIGPALIAAFLANSGYALSRPSGAAFWIAIVAATAGALVLAVTAFVQVPLHARLEYRDLETIGRLNANEWLRAAATFVQAACDVVLLWLALVARA
jgi:hypothetical protein